MLTLLRRLLIRLAVLLGGALAVLWIVGERGRLIRRSTLDYIQAIGGWRTLFKTRFWEAYIYGRWTKQYIGLARRVVFPRVNNHGSADPMWAEGYHGKVVPLEAAKALISVDKHVPLHSLNEQIIPYQTARDIVLNGPPDVVAYECACRATAGNPCDGPTQVCMVVGKPFTDFVLEHNPDQARRLTTAEAVQLLEDEHARGHMHAAYFKDVMADRFYAICNCCPCCCAGIESMQQAGVPMVIPSGYVVQVDDEMCIACEACADVCPFDAITMGDVAVIDWEACMGCGVCEGQCTQEALALVRDARKGDPLVVGDLIPPEGE
jgi:NAD-dependent dihydropyrimidine dehydrogenase PreA subunit